MSKSKGFTQSNVKTTELNGANSYFINANQENLSGQLTGSDNAARIFKCEESGHVIMSPPRERGLRVLVVDNSKTIR